MPRSAISGLVARASLLLQGAVFLVCALCNAQDLTPRAYTITPVNGNAINVTYAFVDGAILFDPAIPITGAKGTLNNYVLAYYYSGDFFGRSFNVTAALPYAEGNLSGEYAGRPQALYRSGLTDSVFRFSVNLKGGPAMKAPEFVKWRQKTLIGASIKVVAPTGQYDPRRLVNQGSNRWQVKPEIGVSQAWRRLIFDAYAGVWFFSANDQFFTGKNTLTQAPMGSFEAHVSYDIKPRLWVSLDGNYWVGGRTTINGVVNLGSLQNNSRIGVTAAVPISKHQSLKASFSDGAYIVYGGDYRILSLGWQYSWLGTKFR